jgi:hypothetical protein
VQLQYDERQQQLMKQLWAALPQTEIKQNLWSWFATATNKTNSGKNQFEHWNFFGKQNINNKKQTLILRKKKRKILKLKCNKQTNKEQRKKFVKQLLHLHTGSSNCIFRFIRRWGKSWGVWYKQELFCCCVEVVQLQ